MVDDLSCRSGHSVLLLSGVKRTLFPRRRGMGAAPAPQVSPEQGSAPRDTGAAPAPQVLPLPEPWQRWGPALGALTGRHRSSSAVPQLLYSLLGIDFPMGTTRPGSPG